MMITPNISALQSVLDQVEFYSTPDQSFIARDVLSRALVVSAVVAVIFDVALHVGAALAHGAKGALLMRASEAQLMIQHARRVAKYTSEVILLPMAFVSPGSAADAHERAGLYHRVKPASWLGSLLSTPRRKWAAAVAVALVPAGLMAWRYYSARAALEQPLSSALALLPEVQKFHNPICLLTDKPKSARVTKSMLDMCNTDLACIAQTVGNCMNPFYMLASKITLLPSSAVPSSNISKSISTFANATFSQGFCWLTNPSTPSVPDTTPLPQPGETSSVGMDYWMWKLVAMSSLLRMGRYLSQSQPQREAEPVQIAPQQVAQPSIQPSIAASQETEEKKAEEKPPELVVTNPHNPGKDEVEPLVPPSDTRKWTALDPSSATHIPTPPQMANSELPTTHVVRDTVDSETGVLSPKVEAAASKVFSPDLSQQIIGNGQLIKAVEKPPGSMIHSIGPEQLEPLNRKETHATHDGTMRKSWNRSKNPTSKTAISREAGTPQPATQSAPQYLNPSDDKNDLTKGWTAVDNEWTVRFQGQCKSVSLNKDYPDLVLLTAKNNNAKAELELRQEVETAKRIREHALAAHLYPILKSEFKDDAAQLAQALAQLYSWGTELQRGLNSNSARLKIDQSKSKILKEKWQSVFESLRQHSSGPSWVHCAENLVVDYVAERNLPLALPGIYTVSTKRAHSDLEKGIRDKELQTRSASLDIAAQVLRGMADLHTTYEEQLNGKDARFIHGDLKLENVLVYKTGHKYVAKISDFGKTRAIADNKEELYLGNPRYAPPENTTSAAGDVWGTAIMLIEILEARFLSEDRKSLLLPASSKWLAAPKTSRWGIERYMCLHPDCPQHDGFKVRRVTEFFWGAVRKFTGIKWLHQQTQTAVHQYIDELGKRMKEADGEAHTTSIDGMMHVLKQMTQGDSTARWTMGQARAEFDKVVGTQ